MTAEGTERIQRVYVQREVAMPHMEPERVDAIQWTGDNLAELVAAFPEVNARVIGDDPNFLAASVDGGELFVKVGWWLIRTPKGSVYAMLPAAFEQRYRPGKGDGHV